MTGRHNYTSLTNGLAPQGPTQMNAIYAFFDQRVSESAANAGAFPAATARPAGHLIVANDTKALYLGDGTAWTLLNQPWTNFTPSWTGLTLGTGGSTTVARYRVSGGMASVQLQVILGTSGFSVSDPVLAYPIAAVSTPDFTHTSGVTFIDDSAGGTGRYGGFALAISTGIRLQANGNPLAAVISTVPFTWAATDRIVMLANYPV